MMTADEMLRFIEHEKVDLTPVLSGDVVAFWIIGYRFDLPEGNYVHPKSRHPIQTVHATSLREGIDMLHQFRREKEKTNG